jgi:hypothetical protein
VSAAGRVARFRTFATAHRHKLVRRDLHVGAGLSALAINEQVPMVELIERAVEAYARSKEG